MPYVEEMEDFYGCPVLVKPSKLNGVVRNIAVSGAYRDVYIKLVRDKVGKETSKYKKHTSFHLSIGRDSECPENNIPEDTKRIK